MDADWYIRFWRKIKMVFSLLQDPITQQAHQARRIHELQCEIEHVNQEIDSLMKWMQSVFPEECKDWPDRIWKARVSEESEQISIMSSTHQAGELPKPISLF